jgi:hypothetical protein
MQLDGESMRKGETALGREGKARLTRSERSIGRESEKVRGVGRYNGKILNFGKIFLGIDR